MFDKSLYDDAFFKWHYDNVHNQCVRVGRELVKELKITSLIDFGCGIGSYLYGAEKHCIVFGLELSKIAEKYTPKDFTNNIAYEYDITEEIDDIERCQVSLCIEVAEHIDPEKSEMLIQNITNLTEEYCIFTAAPPGQEGTGHINCQPYEYWIELFKKYGFVQQNILQTIFSTEGDIMGSVSFSPQWDNMTPHLEKPFSAFNYAPDYVRKNLMIFKNEKMYN